MTDPQGNQARRITGRLARMGEDERAFDEEFWRAIPPAQRVELLWDMVLDALAVKGELGEPRLQKSVGRVHRPDARLP